MNNSNGQKNQKNGWQYDDSEGGYLKKTENGEAYILGHGRCWPVSCRFADGSRYETAPYETLRDAKHAAEYLLTEETAR
jgi:hypothetical protein